MDSSAAFSDLLNKASFHFSAARPLIPMYIHLILSALFPIYTGAHASLSRPSSAAKPDKTKKIDDSEDEDEDEDKIQKMEGMSNKDAIILPITAGLVLAGLYFLIMKYGAEMINLILGWYFSGVTLYSVAKLVNDGLNVIIGFRFPTYYVDRGSLWKVLGSERKAIRMDDESQTRDTPDPGPLGRILSLPLIKSTLWNFRGQFRQKYIVKAYFQNVVDLHAKLTAVNVFSALFGIGTIVYVNTVSKLWFLSNLQGFAVSYSALQIMSPTTFATGSLILGSLFCYDIWAVFFTPLMVTVAKNLDQPIKLVFPRPDEPSPTPGEPPIKSFSMLGLGDIVLPGIMIGLALRFDLYLYYLKKQSKHQETAVDSNGQSSSQEVIQKAPYVAATGHWGDRFWTARLPSQSLPAQLRSSFPKPYFTASMIGYVIGMLTTLSVMSVFHHAQPALLYLVPGVLVSLWGTGLLRGELKEMWEFSEAVTGEQIEEGDHGEKKEDNAQAEKSPKGLFERLWQEIWTGSEKKDQPKSDEGSTNKMSSLTEAKTKQDKASSSGKNRNDDDLLFSFSITRYNANTRKETKVDNPEKKSTETSKPASSPSRSETSDDAGVVSPDDLDGANDSEPAPRYRTRSTRRGDAEGGVAV